MAQEPSSRLSVVVPVYNERLTLPEILERIQAVAMPKEIVIVDDCSTDGTRDYLRRFETELIRSALIQTGGRQRQAARLLGTKVTTLNTKIKRYKIDIPE